MPEIRCMPRAGDSRRRERETARERASERESMVLLRSGNHAHGREGACHGWGSLVIVEHAHGWQHTSWHRPRCGEDGIAHPRGAACLEVAEGSLMGAWFTFATMWTIHMDDFITSSRAAKRAARRHRALGWAHTHVTTSTSADPHFYDPASVGARRSTRIKP